VPSLFNDVLCSICPDKCSVPVNTIYIIGHAMLSNEHGDFHIPCEHVINY
jgi:hypothetical protein